MRGAAAGRVFARGGAVVARPDAVASDPPSAGASAAPASGGFAAGLKAFDQGRHAEAFALWLPLAEQGRVEGQFNIAVMYEQGLGLAKDEAEAARWYLAAAERGDVAAQRKTGNLCEAGVGVPKDLGNASFWYARRRRAPRRTRARPGRPAHGGALPLRLLVRSHLPGRDRTRAVGFAGADRFPPDLEPPERRRPSLRDRPREPVRRRHEALHRVLDPRHLEAGLALVMDTPCRTIRYVKGEEALQLGVATRVEAEREDVFGSRSARMKAGASAPR